MIRPFGKLLILGDEKDKHLLKLSSRYMNYPILFERPQNDCLRFHDLSLEHQDFIKELQKDKIEFGNSKELLVKLSNQQIKNAQHLTEVLYGHVGVTTAFFILIDRKKYPTEQYSPEREIQTSNEKLEIIKKDFYGKTINGRNIPFENKISWLTKNL